MGRSTSKKTKLINFAEAEIVAARVAEMRSKPLPPPGFWMKQDDGVLSYRCSADSCGYDGSFYCENCGSAKAKIA